MSIALLGAKTRDVEFEAGETLETIFDRYEIEVADDKSIQVNGEDVDFDYQPEAGAIVAIAPNVGNGR
jgi:hypothetical protein